MPASLSSENFAPLLPLGQITGLEFGNLVLSELKAI